LLSILEILYKSKLKHHYFHSKDKKQQQKTVYEQFVRLHTSTQYTYTIYNFSLSTISNVLKGFVLQYCIHKYMYT